MLSLSRITRSFGRVTALREVDFQLQAGRVHALLGENGAGKSTLMHIAYGMLPADSGEIRLDGRAVTIRSPRAARTLGIGMVHQHFTSVPALTVAENIALAAGTAVSRAVVPGDGQVLTRLMQGLEPGARVETLSVGQRQRLEIVKALAGRARILLLDEPTAVLAPPEVVELLQVIRTFAAGGGAVVLITHKLDEALAAADDVTVLRQGQVTLTGPIAQQTATTLAAAMIGSGPVPAEPPRAPAPGELVAEFAEATVAPAEGRGPGLRGATLLLRGGQITGVAAVEGNGQRELLLAAAGLLPARSGRITLRGTAALVPEDRTTEGLVPELSLTENVALGLTTDPAWTRGPWMNWPAAGVRTRALLEEFDVRASGPDERAAALSGGNQQKLVLARVMEQRPRLLVAENPTRGLDIRATAAVHVRLREAARAGIAVLLHSTDLDEVLALADRVLVLFQGGIAELPVPADRDRVGRAMLGLRDGDAP